MAGHVCWFEITSTDPVRAKEFYSALFGWENKLQRENYWEMVTDRVPHGGLMKKSPVVPNTGVYIYVRVDSIEKTLDRARQLGGHQLVPKTEIPGFGFFAFFADLDGNAIGIYSEA